MKKLLVAILLLSAAHGYSHSNLEGFERVYKGRFAQVEPFQLQTKAVPIDQIIVKNLTDGVKIRIDNLYLFNKYNYDSFIEFGYPGSTGETGVYSRHLDEKKMKIYDELKIELGTDYYSTEWTEVLKQRYEQTDTDNMEEFVNSGEFEIYIKYNYDMKPSSNEWSLTQIKKYPLEFLQGGNPNAYFSCVVDHRLGGIPETINGIRNPKKFHETLNKIRARKGIISCQIEGELR
jgi:hypothetical protein